MIKCELSNVDTDSSKVRTELDVNDTNDLTMGLGYIISSIINTAMMSMDSDTLTNLDFNDFVSRELGCALVIATDELIQRLELNPYDLVRDTMTHYKEFSKRIFKD